MRHWANFVSAPFVTFHSTPPPGPLASIPTRPSSLLTTHYCDTGRTNLSPLDPSVRQLHSAAGSPRPSSSQVLHGHPVSSAPIYLQGTTSRLYCILWPFLAHLSGSCRCAHSRMLVSSCRVFEMESTGVWQAMRIPSLASCLLVDMCSPFYPD